MGTGISTFFDDAYGFGCDVVSCTTAGTDKVKVTTEPVSSLVLSQRSNIVDGYEGSIQLKCIFGSQAVEKIYSATIVQDRDCGTALTDDKAQTPEVVVSYLISSDDIDHGTGVSSYFSNKDSVNCPITSCVLKDSTCSTTTTFAGVSLGA
jgi:hypothetical protein